jgi:hypothetical protein
VNDPRQSGSPGEQFRDRLFGSLASRDAGDTNIVGAVVVIGVILLLIPRGENGPSLWLVLALVFGGGAIETVRVIRSGAPPREALRTAGRQLSGPIVFVLAAALFTQVALVIRDTPIPQPVAVGAALLIGVVAWLAVWRLLRAS